MKAVVIVSDTHVGSYFGLCPAEGLRLDNGAVITPSKFQAFLYQCWLDFFDQYVPSVARNATSIALVHNGDGIDGNHHEAVDLVPSVQSQERAFVSLMQPIVNRFDYFAQVRGTEAHGGIGEQSTERTAEILKSAKDDSTGCYSWQELWLDINGVTMQFSHHISGTTSAAYETSAPMRELVATLIESAQWERPLPSLVVRSHRHRFVKVPIATKLESDILCVVTPGWQLKTPFTYRVDRVRMPHIGGVVVTVEDKNTWTVHRKLYPLPAPKIQVI